MISFNGFAAARVRPCGKESVQRCRQDDQGVGQGKQENTNEGEARDDPVICPIERFL